MIPEKIREIAHRHWNTTHTTPEDIEAAIREALGEVEKGMPTNEEAVEHACAIYNSKDYPDNYLLFRVVFMRGFQFFRSRLTTGEKGEGK